MTGPVWELRTAYGFPRGGRVERMKYTIKETTVKRYHYETYPQLETHITDFIVAYNCAHRLKTLQGLTPFEYICKIWTAEPERFNVDPNHHALRLNAEFLLT